MLLAWKKAQRFDASTFLLMDSVCAPLPSVSDSARNNAITAISNAIFLLEPEACSACSACSMLSCALMILSPDKVVSTIAERHHLRKWQADMTMACQAVNSVFERSEWRFAWKKTRQNKSFTRADARCGKLPGAARCRCQCRSGLSRVKRGR